MKNFVVSVSVDHKYIHRQNMKPVVGSPSQVTDQKVFAHCYKPFGFDTFQPGVKLHVISIDEGKCDRLIMIRTVLSQLQVQFYFSEAYQLIQGFFHSVDGMSKCFSFRPRTLRTCV